MFLYAFYDESLMKNSILLCYCSYKLFRLIKSLNHSKRFLLDGLVNVQTLKNSPFNFKILSQIRTWYETLHHLLTLLQNFKPTFLHAVIIRHCHSEPTLLQQQGAYFRHIEKKKAFTWLNNLLTFLQWICVQNSKCIN